VNVLKSAPLYLADNTHQMDNSLGSAHGLGQAFGPDHVTRPDLQPILRLESANFR
jgi:hypothetical protein